MGALLPRFCLGVYFGTLFPVHGRSSSVMDQYNSGSG